MPAITISQIEERLRQLPPDKLAVVLDFVSYLSERPRQSEALQTMLASEAVLRRDWDRPEEDEAWADL
jgi:TorA maturation chaperone TorD